MCLLTYFAPEAQPDTNALWNGSITNNDGHGFAIVSHGQLIVRHGMDAASTIDLFETTRRRHPTGPALFHSRFGTGGSYTRYNCHPFRFGGDRRTVVGHNGILPTTVQPGKKDKRCDTRIAAEEVLPKGFGHLSNPVNRDRVAAWIGKSNKLVILTVNPDYDQSAYIINENMGTWVDGAWYSNSAYKDRTYYNWAPSSTDGSPENPKTSCTFCGGTDIGKYAECKSCGLCVECLHGWDRCDCPWWNYGGKKITAETTVLGYPADTAEEWLKWVREQNDRKAIESGTE